MSKWFSLTLALVVIAASSTASAEVIKRFGRLVAEEQAAPEPQPAAEAAPGSGSGTGRRGAHAGCPRP